MDHSWKELVADCSQRGWTFYSGGAAHHECMAWLPRGIAGPKLAGLFADRGAKIISASTDRIRARLGKKRLLPLGPEGQQSIPIEMEILLNRETICARSLTHVSVVLRPLIEGVPAEQLRRRYCLVVRDLWAFFMAENLQRREEYGTDARHSANVQPVRNPHESETADGTPLGAWDAEWLARQCTPQRFDGDEIVGRAAHIVHPPSAVHGESLNASEPSHDSMELLQDVEQLKRELDVLHRSFERYDATGRFVQHRRGRCDAEADASAASPASAESTAALRSALTASTKALRDVANVAAREERNCYRRWRRRRNAVIALIIIAVALVVVAI